MKCGRSGAVIVVTGFVSKGLEFKFYNRIIGIGQEGHPNLKCYNAPAKSLVPKRMCSG